MSSSEYEEWTKKIAAGEFKEIKFHSECYFLTLICHHLSVIPLIRKYIRRIRQIREYSRIADELEQSTSVGGSNSAQRRQMITRLNQQNRRLARYVVIVIVLYYFITRKSYLLSIICILLLQC